MSAVRVVITLYRVVCTERRVYTECTHSTSQIPPVLLYLPRRQGECLVASQSLKIHAGISLNSRRSASELICAAEFIDLARQVRPILTSS